MDPLTLYINPRCSKSRAAVQLLDDHHASFAVVNYLETPLDGETIGRLVDLIEGEPGDLVRTGDDRFRQLGLSAADVADRAGVMAVLVDHPELMQRPVAVRGDRAVIARPPELVTSLIV
jgi:arsenate reductase